MQAVLSRKHVFVTLPTGYGKSAIFHNLPFCAMSLLFLTVTSDSFFLFVMIISPLVSLMRDQMTKLQQEDIQAALVMDLACIA